MSGKLLCECGNCHYCMDENVVKQMYGTKPQIESTIIYDSNGRFKIETCVLMKPNTAKNKAGHLDDKTFCECPLSAACDAHDSMTKEDSFSLSFQPGVARQRNSLFEGPTMTHSISRFL